MALQLQFSLTASAFGINPTTRQFSFPEPLGNSYEIPKDVARAGFIVVNGWLGKPGDTIHNRIVILNPRGDSVHDSTMPPDTITDQLMAVLGVKLDFPFGVSGWHRVQVFDDQQLYIDYPVRVRRSDMTTAAMEREQLKRRKQQTEGS